MIPKEPSQEEFDKWLNAIFSPVDFGKENDYIDDAITAFENLTFYFIQRMLKGNPKLARKLIVNARFDYVGLTSMLKRFQRDAFGVRRFEQYLESKVKARKVDKATAEEMFKEVCSLGLRITAPSPRKTRVPAAFSLWMCVLRPVSFDSRELEGVDVESLELFCAMLNFFIASSYLTKFGDIELGQSEKDKSVRLDRIKHDFTYREVSFSTLETFYGGIFKLDPRFAEHENLQVGTCSTNLDTKPNSKG